MIFSHGNAEDINKVKTWLLEFFLVHVNVNAIAYEYTGYNPTDNFEPAEAPIYDDI